MATTSGSIKILITYTNILVYDFDTVQLQSMKPDFKTESKSEIKSAVNGNLFYVFTVYMISQLMYSVNIICISTYWLSGCHLTFPTIE